MPRISVIVPARDVGDLLGSLLDDLRHQTHGDFEVVVIDDGSVDDTPDVITKVAAADRRFRHLTLDGDGPSIARNTGVAAATGEFLAFADADDRISHRHLEHLVTAVDHSGSDVATGAVRRLDGYRTYASVLHREAITETAHGTTLHQAPQLVWDTTVWNKLVRRSFWEEAGLTFEPNRWINDLAPSLTAYARARQVDVVADVIYYWRIRSDLTASITDRKHADQTARTKSLEDRLRALEVARQAVVDHLDAPDEVLRRFDEKVLLHDLWTYLPYVATSGDDYRQLLAGRTRDLLAGWGIDPEAFDIGPHLRAVYGAVLADDHDRLERLLAPGSHVVARPLRRGLGTSLVLDGRRPRPWTWLGQAWGRATGRTEPPPLRVDARIDRVDLPADGRPGTLTGVVRIREGRSDLEGPWTAAARLVGVETRQVVTGEHHPVGPPPDTQLHPLQRSGWRPFQVPLDVAAAVGSVPDEERWNVRLEVRLGRAATGADTLLSAAAGRRLATGVPVTGDRDVVPVATRTERLQLRTEGTELRLRGTNPAAGGRVTLALEAAPGIDLADAMLWLQSTDGTQRTEPSRAIEALAVPPPDADGPDRFELWSEVAGTRTRVRGHPDLRTVGVATGVHDGQPVEVVLRPTIRGRVIVERRAPCLELWWLRAGDDPDTVVLGGTGDPAALGDEPVLELRCRWTEDTISVPLDHDLDGWQATVPVERLPGGSAEAPLDRGWSLHVTAPGSDPQPVRLPAEGRDRFPLTVETCDPPVQATAGPGMRPKLWAVPEEASGRWTTLRKVERVAEATATAGTTASG